MQLHTDISPAKLLNASFTNWLTHGTVPVLRRIEAPDNARVFVVGDLHGMRSLLITRLLEQGFDFSKDICICTGDLINKGGDSLHTLRLLNEPWFFSVRGNHEELALEALELKCPWTMLKWQKEKGGTWFFGLSDTDKQEATGLILNQVAELPLAIEINVRGKRFGVTHGDFNANEWSLDQFSRSKFLKELTSDRSMAIQVKQKKGSTFSNVEGVDAIYHGHTTFKHFASAGNRHWIDTNAHATGNLTVLELAPALN